METVMLQELAGSTFFIRTFGCQMNENDSEHLAGLLVRAGAVPSPVLEESDIILINTCAVRKKPEEKIDSFLGRLAKLKKSRPRVIGLVGCVAQLRRAELIKKRPIIDLVAGPANYHRIAFLVVEARNRKIVETAWSRKWREISPDDTLRASRVSAFVPIMEGCDNFCSYCVVPFSRGREKCRPMSAVLEEIGRLAESGYREITLLGQNVNSYTDPETGTGFAGLLRRAAGTGDIPWIRFITSHPRDFTPGIAQAMAELPNVCRQLHLPLQSGSTAVLSMMNREYGREAYMDTVDRLKSLLPGIHLSTDIIVGFPGETEADFEATLDALRRIRFANIFSFRYSPRPRTAAAKILDDVPQKDKQRRLIVLQAVQKNIQAEFHRSLIGKTLTVLCDGRSKRGGTLFSGRTEGLQVVNFDAPRDVQGDFVEVEITEAGAYSLRGTMRSQA